MKRGVWVCLVLAVTVLFSGCFNFFHDLVPPDENRILSFEAEGQTGQALITEKSVTLTLGKTETLRLIPRIQISPQATLFPVTLDYIRAAFPNADIAKETGSLLSSGDLAAALIDLIKRNPDFAVPALTIPIDFTGPVIFFVLSGQGNVRQYTVQLIIDTGEPRLLSFAFSKYDNPELVKDGFALVHEQSKTVTAAAVYPVEIPGLSYALVPSFELLGDTLAIDGKEIRSGIDAVQFKGLGFQTKTITVTRDGQSLGYTLNLDLSEDLDTVRSITDFRFTRTDNPGIAATAVAAIVNAENTGTITVQVFYSGPKPSTLQAQFISPGTVSVGGITQTGGVSQGDFSSPLEYRVVSRNGMYMRIYTVRVEFYSLANDAPKITSFRFSQAANHALVQDTQGEISGGTILIDAKYGLNPPEQLIPEFTANGLVLVNGAAQTSGISGQDFSRQVKYTVRHFQYEGLITEYWVQVRMVRDNSSYALISAFAFHPDENPGLGGEISSKIDQTAGTITVYAPVGSGVTNRLMFPRFSAQGQVKVDGDIQASGVSGRTFNTPVTYTVTSANGLSHKTYTVNVREVRSRMYVNPGASGWNDGSSWADAFVSLQSACKAAAEFPEDTIKEIWIAGGTYKSSLTGDRDEYFLVSPNTSFLGGFAGWETDKGQRNPGANPVIISGNLGGGVKSWSLLYGWNARDTAFESLTIEDGDIYLRGADTAAFSALTFTNGALNASGAGDVTLSGTSVQSGRVSVTGRDIAVSGLTFTNGTLNASGAGDVTLSGTSVQNGRVSVTGRGIAVSGLTIDGFSGGSGLSVNGSSGRVNIRDTVVRNGENPNGSGGGLYLNNTTGSVEIDNLTLEKVKASSGGGMYIRSSGSVSVRNSRIADGQALNWGGGMNISSSGSVSVRDSRITQVQAAYGGGMEITTPNLTLDGVTIDGASASGSYGGIYYHSSSGKVTITGTEIKNVTAGNRYGAGYIYSASSVINRLTVTNARADNHGGFYLASDGSGSKLLNSRFEKCVGTSHTGALGITGDWTVEDTNFINCTSGGYAHQVELGTYPWDDMQTPVVFRRCTFTHNASFAAVPPSGPPYFTSLEGGGETLHTNNHFVIRRGSIRFENCSFTGLKNIGGTNEEYLFHLVGNPTFVTCTFDFSGGGRQGLFYGCTFRNYDAAFDLDGCKITNYNEAQPLIRVEYSTNNNWRIRTNNTYNGITLNGFNLSILKPGIIMLEHGAAITQ